MRVLLTGAAGFIGSHIHRALRQAGDEVIAVDAMLEVAHGVGAQPPDGVQRMDVRDPDALAPLLRGVEVVCHQAAVVGAGVSAADAPAYASHNDVGTAVLLAGMARAGVPRLVLASSMVVYGEGNYCDAAGRAVVPAPRRREDLDRGRYDHLDPITGTPLSWAAVDETSPLGPRSLYAASKVAQENYALAWAAATGATVTALRYHNVYGDGMPKDTPYSGVAAIFRSALEAGEAPRVFEDGRQMRDFVHVRDVAAANVAAVHRDVPGFVALNIASGTPISIAKVAELLAQARGGKTPVVTGDYRPGDVRHIVASPTRAQAVLDFTAQVPPAQGLAEFATVALRSAAGVGSPTW